MSAVFEYDEAAHLYRLGGAVLPHVTQVLDSVGLCGNFNHVSPAVLKAAQRRGDAVHLACRYLDEGCLDWTSVDGRIMGYVEAYAKFKQEFDFRPMATEVPLYDPILRYAGTPDAWSEDLLIDRKTGPHAPWMDIQIAAYEALVRLQSDRKRKELIVQLCEDGKYKLYEPKERQRIKLFQAALALHNWKSNN